MKQPSFSFHALAFDNENRNLLSKGNVSDFTNVAMGQNVTYLNSDVSNGARCNGFHA